MDDIREATIAFEAQKIGIRQTKDGVILMLAVHPQECHPDLIRDALGSRYQVALVKLNDQDEPEAPPSVVDGNRAVESAGMICREPRFQDWMQRKGYVSGWDQPGDAPRSIEQATAYGLRRLLGIESRSELRVNERARKLFQKLKEEFENGR